MTTITATDNASSTNPGATIAITNSLGALNYAEWTTANKDGFQQTGLTCQGDGTINVPASLPNSGGAQGPLDTQMLFQLRVRSEGIGVSYSNTVFVCPTMGFLSPQTNVLIGLQTELAIANLPQIGIAIYRSEDSGAIAGTIVGKWPAILLQKSPVSERRTTRTGTAVGGLSLTSWEWPVELQIVDKQHSPTALDEIHNFWRLSCINLFDRITAARRSPGPLRTYPTCTRTTVEPGPIQTYAMVGGRETNDAGYAVWISQIRIWCLTDMPIGGFASAGFPVGG